MLGRIHGRICSRKGDRLSIKHSQLIDWTGPKSTDSAIKLQLTTTTSRLLSRFRVTWHPWKLGFTTPLRSLRNACGLWGLLWTRGRSWAPSLLATIPTVAGAVYRRRNGLAAPYSRELAPLQSNPLLKRGLTLYGRPCPPLSQARPPRLPRPLVSWLATIIVEPTGVGGVGGCSGGS